MRPVLIGWQGRSTERSRPRSIGDVGSNRPRVAYCPFLNFLAFFNIAGRRFALGAPDTQFQQYRKRCAVSCSWTHLRSRPSGRSMDAWTNWVAGEH